MAYKRAGYTLRLTSYGQTCHMWPLSQSIWTVSKSCAYVSCAFCIISDQDSQVFESIHLLRFLAVGKDLFLHNAITFTLSTLIIKLYSLLIVWRRSTSTCSACSYQYNINVLLLSSQQICDSLQEVCDTLHYNLFSNNVEHCNANCK